MLESMCRLATVTGFLGQASKLLSGCCHSINWSLAPRVKSCHSTSCCKIHLRSQYTCGLGQESLMKPIDPRATLFQVRLKVILPLIMLLRKTLTELVRNVLLTT